MVASDNDLRLTASGLPAEQLGIFVTSRLQGFIPGPGGSQGSFCLGLPFGRFNGPGQTQTSDATGSFSLETGTQQMPLTPPVAAVAGETWNFQACIATTTRG
ncbi:MAG: hypothetical protein GY711_13650 [bacterium]|nr:hypothetical protein [bacterium]